MYQAAPDRYESMIYRRCGASGILLPAISLGLWHNFGAITPLETQQQMLRTAFDCGITHFDMANNYGPPYGEAERNFGILFARDWKPYRDELILSSKAGYDMWPGPYGDHGSRKYLIASIDQSLKRTGLEYFDIFYHHRPDPDTPIEETMGALYDIIRSGKALYAGISNYNPEQTRLAAAAAEKIGFHLLIHQPRYSMFVRNVEQGLTDVLREKGIGCIAFGPLAGGLLTNRYLHGIPADSRAGHDPRFLKPEQITEDKLQIIRQLQAVAEARGQSLAQMALAWTLRLPEVTTALIGASRPQQILENVKALENLQFSEEELKKIDEILSA